jgi:hypothetical protein
MTTRTAVVDTDGYNIWKLFYVMKKKYINMNKSTLKCQRLFCYKAVDVINNI